ncbi:MAG: MBL fold metallo-hydrolase [Bryobacteraceae bacterium]
MSRWIAKVAGSTALFAAVCVGQTPKPDSPKIQAEIERIKKVAGADWTVTEKYFCETEGTTPSATAPLIEPTKLFDNLYVFGRQGTATYIISTSEGLIAIDSGYAGQTDEVFLGAMKKLGLDPMQIKYLLIAHGHADHFGGARYLQDSLTVRVMMGTLDWDALAMNPPAPNAPQPPLRDIGIVEERPITVGDTTVTPIWIPGHTPGSFGFIFQVKDNGVAHTAGLFGGTALITKDFTEERMKQYLGSLDKWAGETKKRTVDVEIQNHPTMDGLVERIAKLKERKAGQPNPFVVGADSYQRFLSVMSDCIKVRVARGKE